MTVSALSSSAIATDISNIETAMKAPITKLQQQTSTDSAEISAWGAISGSMSSLSQALAGIKNVSSLDFRSATSSNTLVANAIAASSAQAGTYNLTNVTLAKGQELYSSLLGSGNATLTGGKGSLVIGLQSGKNETISLGSGSLTLNKVAAAINKDAGGVQASVIGTAAGARLVLASSGTGASAAFNVSGTGALAQFDYKTSSANSTEIMAQTAANAAFTLNGIPLSGSSNTLSNVVNGLTLTLASSGDAVVSVSSSPATLTSALSEITTGLNSAIAIIAKETKFASTASTSSASSATITTGPLMGNYSATELKNNLLSAVSQLAAGGISAGAIGLSVSSSGSISFNTSSFTTQFASNPTAVESLVSHLYSALSTVTTGAIGAASGSGTTKTTGFLTTETTSLNAVITSIDNQINQMSTLDASKLQAVETEFTAAESKASNASIVESYLSIFTGSGSSTTKA